MGCSRRTTTMPPQAACGWPGARERVDGQAGRRTKDRRLAADCRAARRERLRGAPPARRVAAPAGRHRRRRGARGRRARRGDEGVLQAPQAAQAERPHRRGEQPHRRPHDRGGGHRGSQAARERGPLSRAGGAADPDRRGRPRLPGALGERQRRGPGRAPRAARRRLPRPHRGVHRGLPARRRAPRGRRPRRLRPSPRADSRGAVARPRRRPQRARGGLGRLRAERPGGLRRAQLRLHPHPRLGRQLADGRDRAGARGRDRGGRAPEDRARPPGRLRARRPRARARRPGARGARERAPGLRPRARLLASVLPGPAGFARHPRDRARGRHRAPRRPRVGAPAPRRRPRARGRPARRRRGRPEAARGRPQPLARGSDRPRDGALMDLNKEIKLGDIFRRRAKTPGEEVAAAPEEEKPKKERRALFSRPPREKKEKAPKQPKAPKAEKKPKEPRGRRAKTPAVEERPAVEVPKIPLMRAFNLMPGEEAREKKSSRAGLPQIAVALLGVLVFAGLGGGYLFTSAGVTSKQSELDDLRAQLAELEVPSEKPEPGAVGAQAVVEGQARTTALSTALASRIAWDRLLRKISQVLPDGVWLKQLSAVGQATSQEQVAVLLARLESIPELTVVQLQSSTRADGEAGRVYEFSIIAGVDPLG